MRKPQGKQAARVGTEAFLRPRAQRGGFRGIGSSEAIRALGVVLAARRTLRLASHAGADECVRPYTIGPSTVARVLSQLLSFHDRPVGGEDRKAVPRA